MAVKVSVVVPVYNPGDHIDDCVRSLVHEQSLPRDEYEVVFVDDGSTDATPAKLDALARDHEHVRVERIENSGWSGRPRNIGIGMARGEFVLFVDNDDYITPRALERLYEVAVRDEADVVLGKVVGHGPGKLVPKGVFERNRSAVTLEEWPGMLWLLSPHKLFRRAFLDEHEIRFPEGRRRLEDHVFVTHAYLHARAVSVVADEVIYHWMLRGRDVNASLRPFDPGGYYANLREVLDLVDEHVPEGELRDRLYLRWLRGKALGRAGGPPFTRWPEDYRRERYEEIRALVTERFPARLDALLPLSWRARGALLRSGDYEGLKALAQFEAALGTVVRVRSAERDGEDLSLSLEARFARHPVRFEAAGDRLRWSGAPGVSFAEDRDARPEVDAAELYVFLRSVADHTEFALPVEAATELVEGEDGLRPVVRGTARLSPRTGAAGAPLPPGEWDAFAMLTVAGFKATGRLRRAARGEPLRFRVGTDGRLVEERAQLRARLATRWPGAARLARRARQRRGR